MAARVPVVSFTSVYDRVRHPNTCHAPPPPLAGKKPFFEIPVFNYHKGYLSVNYSDNYYLLSQRHAEVPKLQVCTGSDACGRGA